MNLMPSYHDLDCGGDTCEKWEDGGEGVSALGARDRSYWR
jgi:hypothetical protein